MNNFTMSYRTLEDQARAIIKTRYDIYIVFGINSKGSAYVGVFESNSKAYRGSRGRIKSSRYFENAYYKVMSKTEVNKEYKRIRGCMPENSTYEALEKTLYTSFDFNMEQTLQIVKKKGRYA